jgi:hypothetical protein
VRRRVRDVAPPGQLNRYPASLFENQNVQRGLVINLGGNVGGIARGARRSIDQVLLYFDS